MRPLYIFYFFCATFCSVHAQTFTIVLGRPTQNSISANIVFAQNTDYNIEYGLSANALNKTINMPQAKATVPSLVEFENLQANSRYFYIVNSKPTNTTTYKKSDVYSFHTQRAEGETYTFTIDADQHLYDKKGHGPLYDVCISNQAKDKPDFMISLGDMFGDDHTPDETTSQDMKELHEHYLKYLGNLTHSVPFFFCLGNHEGENGYYLKQDNGENIAAYGTQWRKYYYPNPYPNDFYSGNMKKEEYGIGYPENYYAFTWGDVLFVVLDVYRECDVSAKPQKWDWTLGEDQYSWFRKTLEESSSKYKLVFAHHTRGQGRGGLITARGYEWGGYNNDKYEFDEKRPGWGKPIQKVMNDAGVNIFFQGHDHLFGLEKVDNVIYQEVPMASDSSYKIGVTDNGDAYTDVILDGSGHLRVKVNPNCLTIDYVKAFLPKDTLSGLRKNGEIAYSYSIGQCTTSTLEEESEQINIYPNPANSAVNIISKELINDKEQNIKILDMHGNLFSPELIKVDNGFRVNVENLPKGMYIIKVDSSTRNPIHKKIIIH